MKFFTEAWMRGDGPSNAQALYEAHISAMSRPLPQDAMRLVHGEVNLHDGVLRRVEWSSSGLELQVRAGDLQAGYFDALLSYGRALADVEDEKFLRESVGRRDVEILYDEFDTSETGGWVHRLLYWPRREVRVRFETFVVTVTAAASRFDDGA
jgi:hypothetical protein